MTNRKTDNNLDYSDAEPQNIYTVIPAKTLVKVRLNLIAGGYDDPSKGWTGGWATKSKRTGAIYLKAEYTVVNGEYDGRKIWSLIGLHSDNSIEYAVIGRSFIRALLESANGINSKDRTEFANSVRSLESFADLIGLEFVARVSVKQDQNGNDRNEIHHAITNEHKDYDRLMGINGRHKIGNNKKAGVNNDIKDDEIPF